MKQFLIENWILILSLIYILSPIDFIPEMFLGPIGVIDDLGVVILFLIQAGYRYFRKSKGIRKINTD